jgi:hypothetical protein
VQVTELVTSEEKKEEKPSITIDGNLDKVAYQVISKPSHAKNILPSGQGVPSGMQKRQSVIDQKL